MTETGAIYADGLIQNATWISYLFLVSVGLAITVIIMRFFNQTEFKVGQLTLPIRKFPFVVGSFSVAHLFLTWMLSQKVDLIEQIGVKSSQYAWTKLVNSEAFVFHGMQPRLWQPDAGLLGLGWYAAPPTDTAFWASLVFALAILVSVTVSIWPNKSKRKFWPVFDAIAGGCTLAATNWLIGSHWAIALSKLTGLSTA